MLLMKMKTTYIDNITINGASCIGKSHVACSIPNQDSFHIKQVKYGTVMSVCDGVGSNKFAHYGSRAACNAVYKVFKLHYKKKFEKKDIGTKIEYYYKKQLKRKHRKEAATTCLFAYVYNNSEVIIGQAGDGLILIKLNGKFIVFQNKLDEFMNEVYPITYNHKYLNWKIKHLKFDYNEDKELKILLSTDGISEDILPHKREEFMDYFMNLSMSDDKKHCLQDELDNWSVPGSVDDKTVITFSWRKSQ